MPLANSLINGSAAGAHPPTAPAAETYPGGSVTRTTGIQSPFTGDHNTAAHIATLVLIAAGVLALLQVGGFRFVVDAGIGRR